VAPVTLTLKLHDALDPSVALARLTVPDPGTAVIAPPPQLPARPFGVEITRPAGSESVKPTPVNVEPLGLAMVNVRSVDPLSAMLAAPNAFAIVGGASAPAVVIATKTGAFSPVDGPERMRSGAALPLAVRA